MMIDQGSPSYTETYITADQCSMNTDTLTSALHLIAPVHKLNRLMERG